MKRVVLFCFSAEKLFLAWSSEPDFPPVELKYIFQALCCFYFVSSQKNSCYLEPLNRNCRKLSLIGVYVHYVVYILLLIGKKLIYLIPRARFLS